MRTPAVSVIIVVKNGEKYLKQAIESVLAQSHQPSEIFVVDGKSTDRTYQIVKSYQNIRYIVQTKNGLANARNTGIDNAKGELIAFLDHDDCWPENKLKVQINQFIHQPEIQYSYGRVKQFLEPGCKLRSGYAERLLKESQEGRTPGTLVVRKSLFNQVSNFNSKFIIGCDVEWFTRVKDYKIPFKYTNEILLYKRIHDTNLSRNVHLNRKELFQIVQQSLKRQRLVNGQHTLYIKESESGGG